MGVTFKFTKLRDVKSPTRWTRVSSGFDFYIPEDLKPEDIKFTPTLTDLNVNVEEQVHDGQITIPAGLGVLIPSWLKILMEPDEVEEDATYEMVLYNKSGVAVKYNLLVWANVIDNDYRGEFNIHLINVWLDEVTVEFGQKIVQWIIRKVYLPAPYKIDQEEYEANAQTERGEGWFGSTWTK